MGAFTEIKEVLKPTFNVSGFLDSVAFSVIDEIFAEFRSDDGFARPSRYEIVLEPPSLKNDTNFWQRIMGDNIKEGISRKTALRCQSIEFPGRDLETSPDTNIYGPTREVVQGFSFGQITGTFICGSEMREKLFFENWQRLAYNPETWTMEYYNDYVGNIKIFQLDEQDRRRYGVNLVECFPKTIASQPIAYGSVNQVQTVQVSFSYRYWEQMGDEGTSAGKPIIQRILERVINSAESNFSIDPLSRLR
tara:strand:+ start:49 stop:795 length:747 start_codon:yes stop_codon:yes gene_type:complete